MEKLAAEMAAAEEAARRRAEEREREAAEQAEKAAQQQQQQQQQQEAAGNKAAEQSSANVSSTANPTSGTKEEDKPTPMETGTYSVYKAKNFVTHDKKSNMNSGDTSSCAATTTAYVLMKLIR